MATSDYIAGLREHVGTGLLMLPGVSAVVVNDAAGSHPSDHHLPHLVT